jgi:hypothetical protein
MIMSALFCYPVLRTNGLSPLSNRPAAGYEKITNSTGQALFQGKTNLKNIPAINSTQIKQRERHFEDFVPGNLTLFRELKEKAPFNKNVTTNIIPIPPLTKELRNFTISTPTLSNFSSGLSNSSVNIRNVTVQPAKETGIQVSGFVGLVSNKTCGTCTPPDVQIAAGQHEVVEMINNFIGIWGKDNHTLEKLVRINDMFSLTKNDNTSDPNILYDLSSHRWFSSIMLINKNVNKTAVLAAASTTDDPLGTWNIFKFNVTDDMNVSYCPDRPLIGTSNDKVVISVNIVPPDDSGSCYNSGNSASGFQVAVVNKSDMISDTNRPLQTKLIHDMWRISMIPVKDNEGTMLFLVSAGWEHSTAIKVISFDGLPPKLRYMCYMPEFINQTNIPPDAKQPGTDISIDTADSRVLDATFKDGKIWLALGDSCKPRDSDQPRSCIRLIQVDTTNSSAFYDCNDKERISGNVSMNLDIGHHDTYYYRPALELDSRGNLFVVFGYSSTQGVFPSLAVLKLSKLDNGSLQFNAALLKDGTRNTTSERGLFEPNQTCPHKEESDPLPEHQCSRYGDYFSAARDPVDPLSIWVAGQYYDNTTYSTYIAKLSGNGSQ